MNSSAAEDPSAAPATAATAVGSETSVADPTAAAATGAAAASAPPPPVQPPDPKDRVLTVPNLISMARLLLVPVVGVLIFTGNYLAAVVVLAIAGFSDWIDGEIARRFNQASDLGRFLDPSADRLFIAVTIVGLSVQGFVPWWLVGAIFLRELMVGACIPFLVKRGYPGFPVHDIGKAGTFALMYAFPLLLLAQVPGLDGTVVTEAAWIIGWAAALWGVYLYWSAGIAYLAQFRAVLAAGTGSSTSTAR